MMYNMSVNDIYYVCNNNYTSETHHKNWVKETNGAKSIKLNHADETHYLNY